MTRAPSGFGVDRSAINPTLDRATFVSRLTSALAQQFGGGYPISDVGFSLGSASAAVGAQGSSGATVTFLAATGSNFLPQDVGVRVARALASIWAGRFRGVDPNDLVRAAQSPGSLVGGYNVQEVSSEFVPASGGASTGGGATPAANDQAAAAQELAAFVSSQPRSTFYDASGHLKSLSSVAAWQRRMGMPTIDADGKYGSGTMSRVAALLGHSAPAIAGGGGASTGGGGGGGTSTGGGGGGGTSTGGRTVGDPVVYTPPSPGGGTPPGGGHTQAGMFGSLTGSTGAAIVVGVLLIGTSIAYATGALAGPAGDIVALPAPRQQRSRYRKPSTRDLGR